MKNIVLIGMPGCGKSTVARELSRRFSMPLVECDRLIEQQTGLSLARFQQTYGHDAFRTMENRILASIDCQNSIVSTGGSCIYGEDAMQHFRSSGTIVYLHASLETIAHRLRDMNARGITRQKDQTLADLYHERVPLYRKWADILVYTDGMSLFEVVRDTERQLRKRGKR